MPHYFTDLAFPKVSPTKLSLGKIPHVTSRHNLPSIVHWLLICSIVHFKTQPKTMKKLGGAEPKSINSNRKPYLVDMKRVNTITIH